MWRRAYSGCRSWSAAARRCRAKEFLALLDRYPEIRDIVRASVLVGERRWNLRLKNGIDVRLPETEVAAALETLVALDREKKLFTRDIVAIDLRLADRVTVRLSDAAAQARDDALKDKEKEGRRRMSALHSGLTPKMRPLSRSAPCSSPRSTSEPARSPA